MVLLGRVGVRKKLHIYIYISFGIYIYIIYISELFHTGNIYIYIPKLKFIYMYTRCMF